MSDERRRGSPFSRRRTALHLVMSDRDTDLARRRVAEAAYDASEREESPADRIAYYLEKIEIVAFIWADATAGLATCRDRVSLVGRGDFFVFVDVCVGRVEGAGAAQVMADPCFGLWGMFKSAMAALKGWEGDPRK